VPGLWPGLDFVPTAGVALRAVRDELVIAGAGRESRLREALRAVSGDCDLILIDCAPSLDQLTSNGLTAADGVVVVTHSKLWSANGLGQLLTAIDSLLAYYSPTPHVAGVLINQYKENTVSGRAWVDDLSEAATARGLRILTPPIPKRVVIADAVEASRGLDEWGSGKATALAAVYADHLATLEGARA